MTGKQDGHSFCISQGTRRVEESLYRHRNELRGAGRTSRGRDRSAQEGGVHPASLLTIRTRRCRRCMLRKAPLSCANGSWFELVSSAHDLENKLQNERIRC